MLRRSFKMVMCLGGLFLFLISAAFVHLFMVFNRQGKWRAFSCLNQQFARFLGAIAGLHCTVRGRENIPNVSGYVVVSNHLTYLDGIVLGSILAVTYLSKKAIKKWPLINWMAIISGTIFVDRQKKSASLQTINDISVRLQGATNILLFPEGTSTNAEALKKFQSVFFEAPLSCKAALLPVVVRYRAIDGRPVNRLNRHRIFWWGQVPFQSHLFQLLCMKAIEAEVHIYPVIESRNFEGSSLGRKQLAQHAHDVINAAYPLL